MNERPNLSSWRGIAFVFLSIVVFGVFSEITFGFTVNVVDSSGAPVSGFRWLVEEDTTNQAPLGVGVANSIAVDLHSSYAPVVKQGTASGASAVIGVPDTVRYAVSVLPLSGYTMSGGTVAIGQQEITITVHPQPIPTAQISVLVYNDNNPINSEPDQPVEEGLANFSLILSDAAGQVMQDAFGNMLGTTYQTDVNGNPILDGDGNPVPDHMGDGTILTDANGEAIIKYLAPGKYGIRAVAPHMTTWIQTGTIEGTPGIDAWVKAGEPPLMVEFGPAFYHVFIGFVQQMDLLSTIPNPGGTTGTITGQIVNNHISRAPIVLSYPGAPVPEAWIGLNDTTSLQALYAQPCNEDGTFSIANVPPGTYQLAIWDRPLDYLFAFPTVVVPASGGAVSLGAVPIFGWFGTLEGSVFYDVNENGFRDPGEAGISDQAINIRFRDGTIYQSTVTDMMGEYALEEVFPFFHWLVVEVDYARYQPTGATIVVDHGGPIPVDNGWNMPSFNKLNPQSQAEINPNTGNNLSRTEVGPVLTEGMSLYLGQTNVIDWGKVGYAEGQNGGISGIVYYDTTRAENDPRLAAAEPWEPGIPRVVVALYQDFDYDDMIDDLDGDLAPTLADVDNYPFGNFPAAEDIDRNANGEFDAGDAINIVSTDSWDDAQPDGCVGEPFYLHGQPVRDCYDNLRNYNQVRPALFDGGYMFDSYFPGGIVSNGQEETGLPTGQYIVEASPPPGYEILKEEDKNVDFGDSYIPHTLALPPVCVGDDHLVPAELSLFPGTPAEFAGQTRPLCNRKLVFVTDARNVAADFYFFTAVPKAARAVGLATNDLAPEYDPNSPVSGEKAAPAWIPIAFRDFTGIELVRVYTDEWGAYNALIPSTFTVNIASPTGVAPHMVTICLNDPGPIPDPAHPGQFITDPWFDPGYSQVCYNFNFSPGTVTYLDTPILPISAFKELPQNLLDCSFEDGSPIINTVSGPIGGPYVSAPGQLITITSVGILPVANPDYDVTIPGSSPTISRDYSFGSFPGTVKVNGVSLQNITWSSDGLSISGIVPASMQTGQVVITRGDTGKSSPIGVTLHVGAGSGSVIQVSAGQSIQQAIDSAFDGDLILVGPGRYDENLILWKKVQLQGWGPYATLINAARIAEPTVLTTWKAKVQQLVDSLAVDLVPGQSQVDPFAASYGPGILVLVKQGVFTPASPATIDGFTVFGAVQGGGILVNGYASYLRISNNRIYNNQGVHAGGISVGTPSLVDAGCDPYCDSQNYYLSIHHNQITQNGGLLGGGGVALYTGSDHYTLADNFICGNFTSLSGGGVSHYGKSDEGTILSNKIVFNEVFYGGQRGGDGAGILIAGEPVAAGGITAGAGSVHIISNLIQGNLAGSGEGGGIRLTQINGEDVAVSTAPPNDWYKVEVFNNIIVNNGAAYRGGAISMLDAARVKIINNTISNNESYAASLDAFGPSLTQSIPQVGGIAASVHSITLQGLIGSGTGPEYAVFSNPVLEDNIIWQNKSFYWDSSLNNGLGGLLASPTSYFWDLQVVGTITPQTLSPRFSILTSTAGYDPSNISANPQFLLTYSNQLTSAAVADEGGNMVSVIFHPLSISKGNYHIAATSPAVDLGGGAHFSESTWLQYDYDGDIRSSSQVDSGADELAGGVPVAPEFLGVFRNGTWFLDLNGNGIWNGTPADRRYSFGASGDTPVTGDWNGDGFTEIGTYRNGIWRLDYNGNGSWNGTPQDRRYTFNPFSAGIFSSIVDAITPKALLAAPIPITGDWNGDGRTEIGLFRSGTWFLDFNGNGRWDGSSIDRVYYNYGRAGDLPVSGDWSGSGIDAIGYFSNGVWYLDANANGAWDGAGIDIQYSSFGQSGDKPMSGDWDGDHDTEIGTFRAGSWRVDINSNGIWDGCGIDKCYTFIRSSDIPVIGTWH